MSQPSSSTSSSEADNRKRSAGKLILWVIGWLIALDVSANLLLAYPSDPKATNVDQLRLYFDYGRSMEGKLARITRPDPRDAAPITQAGWYRPLTATQHGSGTRPGNVTIYGMSHAVRLAEAVERTSTNLHARSVGAPGATANWAYGAFLRDQGNRDSKVVVLAIMSSTLPMITTMSPMTWNSSFAMPYAADRFYATPAGLRMVRPPFDSYAGYTAAFYDPARWSAVRDTLRRHDTRYDDLLMRDTVLDHSTIVRLLRRAYMQRQQRTASDRVISGSGVDVRTEEVQVARAIIADFATRARAQGQLPVIFIVNNFGYSDHLFRALQPTLQANGIPYLSSHTIVSPSDPRGYLPDTHFTDANDDRLAQALGRIVLNEESRRKN